MKNRKFIFSSIALLIAMFALPVLAQAPGPDAGDRPGFGPGFGPGRGMPEGMRDTFRLMRLPRQITEINKDSKTALTPAQAKKMLAIVKPLRKSEHLNAEQTKKVIAQFDRILTPSQKEAITNLRPGFGRRMNGRPGEDGRNGSDRPRREWGQGDRPRGEFGPAGGDRPRGEFGQGQGDRPRMRFNPDAMKDFNPFYVKSAKGNTDRFTEMRAKRMNEFFTMLEKAAKVPAAKSQKK